MDLELQRFASAKESTAGSLFRLGTVNPHAAPGNNRQHRCFIVEDQYRPVKVKGDTRIPAGRYEIKLRKEGAMHVRYTGKYPFHRGMLHLQDVPNFEFVYIHTGNKETETEGCLLTGDGVTRTAEGEYETSGSVAAYSRLYTEIVSAMDRERVFINIVDLA